MAIGAAQKTVTTDPTPLSAPRPGNWGEHSVVICNRGSVDVFLGPAGVSTTTGFKLGPGESAAGDDLKSGDVVYGIVATGTSVCHVLQGGA
jgi:hypothetical protein